MRVCYFVLFLFAMSFSFGQNSRNLKGQSKSRFDWERLKPDQFLNYVIWKKNLEEKEGFNPYLDKAYKEVMGKVISCVGKCYISRGFGRSQMNFLTTLRESDEIETGPDSYVWIFLMDGSLVRIAPYSSISLKEINVGKKEIFVQLRFNYGLFYFTNRSSKYVEVNDKYETDPLFLPLQLTGANEISLEKNSNPLSILENKGGRELQKRRANEWISKNNVLAYRKKSFSYLVLPNVTIKGQGISAHMFVANGSKSFFKVSTDKTPAKHMLRGYKNKKQENIKNNIWWEVDAGGKTLVEKVDQKASLRIIEILMKRLPSLFIAREMMFRKYSIPLFNIHLTSDKLAENFGYRLWGELDSKKDTDLQKRMRFLDEYVRRTETTLLQESANLYKKNAYFKKRNFNSEFYSLALKGYLGTVSGDNAISKKILYNYYVDESFADLEEL